MARSVGDDELAMGGGEVAVGNINGDSLLPLGAQSISKLGKVDGGSGIPIGYFGHRAHMIFVDVLRVVKQAADQRGFAIVYAACGREAHQLLGLLGREKLLHGKHIFDGERERHQK